MKIDLENSTLFPGVVTSSNLRYFTFFILLLEMRHFSGKMSIKWLAYRLSYVNPLRIFATQP